MQVVVNIPDDKWVSIRNGEYCGILDDEMYKNIKNGTPLPKGHGRLIDADVVKEGIGNLDGFGVLGRCIDEMPTVIEADGGDAE